MTALSEEETARRERLLASVLRTMVVMVGFGLVASLFDTANDPRVTVAVYLPLILALLGFSRVLRRGRVMLVAWALSLFAWVVIAFATLWFGGMQGGNAVVFGVCVLLIGSLVGGRAAIAMAVGSSAWCLLVALLEQHEALPPQLGPYRPLNVWIAFTVSLMLMSVLLRFSLDSLRASHAKAEAAAAQRDLGLRRSIQAQKMELVGNLASGVAHDFNNLLVVIASASGTMRREVGRDRPEVAGVLDDLDDATARAALMTRQLLSFARHQPAELTELELGAQVKAFAAMLPRLMGPDITLDVQVAEGAMVRASRVGLEQILLNLAVNARDAMPRGGRLALRVLADAEEVRLQVEDTGTGMDDATRAQILAPFFTTKAGGTGLGLATVVDRVAHFGGTLTVASESGRGSTFEIVLPRTGEVTGRAAQGASPAPVAQARRPRLLLVDDDELVRRALTRVLESGGFEVVAAAHGADALELLDRHPDVTCVVSDLAMPVLDGDQLAARLAASHPRLPIVLMSGNRVPSPALAGPHRAFIEKPVEAADLLATIARVRTAA